MSGANTLFLYSISGSTLEHQSNISLIPLTVMAKIKFLHGMDDDRISKYNNMALCVSVNYLLRSTPFGYDVSGRLAKIKVSINGLNYPYLQIRPGEKVSIQSLIRGAKMKSHQIIVSLWTNSVKYFKCFRFILLASNKKDRRKFWWFLTKNDNTLL